MLNSNMVVDWNSEMAEVERITFDFKITVSVCFKEITMCFLPEVERMTSKQNRGCWCSCLHDEPHRRGFVRTIFVVIFRMKKHFEN